MLASVGFESALTSFLLALSGLFSIVNPVGSALIFAQVTATRSQGERAELSRRIGFYAALVMLAALWAGAPILNFFGVSLAALRIAAGVIFLAHGLVKLFGFPEVEGMGRVPLVSLFGLGGVIELVGGALIALGLFTRPAALIASGEMAAAYWMFHAPDSIYPIVNGGDAAILYCFVFLYLTFAGGGAWSLDRAMRSKG